MVRKKKKKKRKKRERGAVRKRGGESRNQKKKKKRKKKLGHRGAQRARGENRTGLVQGKKPNRSSLYIRARGPVFFIFRSFFSLFSFLSSLFLSSLSSFPRFSAAKNTPRRGGRWRRHRAGVAQVPPLFFYLSNPLHSLVMNLRFVFEKLDAASLDLNSKRTGSYPFASCLAGLEWLWAGDW